MMTRFFLILYTTISISGVCKGASQTYEKSAFIEEKLTERGLSAEALLLSAKEQFLNMQNIDHNLKSDLKNRVAFVGFFYLEGLSIREKTFDPSRFFIDEDDSKLLSKDIIAAVFQVNFKKHHLKNTPKGQNEQFAVIFDANSGEVLHDQVIICHPQISDEGNQIMLIRPNFLFLHVAYSNSRRIVTDNFKAVDASTLKEVQDKVFQLYGIKINPQLERQSSIPLFFIRNIPLLLERILFESAAFGPLNSYRIANVLFWNLTLHDRTIKRVIKLSNTF